MSNLARDVGKGWSVLRSVVISSKVDPYVYLLNTTGPEYNIYKIAQYLANDSPPI